LIAEKAETHRYSPPLLRVFGEFKTEADGMARITFASMLRVAALAGAPALAGCVAYPYGAGYGGGYGSGYYGYPGYGDTRTSGLPIGETAEVSSYGYGYPYGYYGGYPYAYGGYPYGGVAVGGVFGGRVGWWGGRNDWNRWGGGWRGGTGGWRGWNGGWRGGAGGWNGGFGGRQGGFAGTSGGFSRGSPNPGGFFGQGGVGYFGGNARR
jgi:hypothetical protein